MKTLLLALLPLAAWAAAAPPVEVAQWTRYEVELTSSRVYANALQDVEVKVTLTAPSGKSEEVLAFWDGGARWLFRYAPAELGTWKWKTVANDATNAGLNSREGTFQCVPYSGGNVLYRRGPVRVAADRLHLEFADGTPFFWMADTVWAGPLLAQEGDWRTFLVDRAAKRFSVIQFMATQNIAAAGDAQGRQAYAGRDKIVLDPYFFRHLDARIDAINAQGMVAAPAFCWAAEWHPSGKLLDPGASLPDDQLILFSKYFIARYGAHSVVWMFAGDHDYRPEATAERWRKLGRAIFGEAPRSIVVMHPAPKMLLKKEFGAEPWLGMYGYQSSHSTDADTLKWITTGEPAQEWSSEPMKPVLNIEPQYEAHMNFAAKRLATPYDVRLQMWESLLTAPMAGITYGAHGIWSWETQSAVPMNHYETGVANPWIVAMHLPGSLQMRLLRDFIERFAWWSFRPDPSLLAEQPGTDAPMHYIAVSRTVDKRVILAYAPQGGTVKFVPATLGRVLSARWYDPSSSAMRQARVETTPASIGFTAPGANANGDNDWILWLDLDPAK